MTGSFPGISGRSKAARHAPLKTDSPVLGIPHQTSRWCVCRAFALTPRQPPSMSPLIRRGFKRVRSRACLLINRLWGSLNNPGGGRFTGRGCSASCATVGYSEIPLAGRSKRLAVNSEQARGQFRANPCRISPQHPAARCATGLIRPIHAHARGQSGQYLFRHSEN